MNIDRLIQRIKESNLSDDRKAQTIRILESIRRALRAIQGLIAGLITAIRAHKDAVRVVALAFLVATLAHAIPWIGTLLGFLIVLVGVGTAFVIEIRRALSGLFDLAATTE